MDSASRLIPCLRKNWLALVELEPGHHMVAGSVLAVLEHLAIVMCYSQEENISGRRLQGRGSLENEMVQTEWIPEMA